MMERLAHDNCTGIEQHIVHSLDLPRREAAWIHRRCAKYVELDELISLGNLGLAEAAATYDAASGTPFRTFARYRVRGAILDSLRSSTVLPRNRWRHLVALREAREVLEQRAAACSPAEKQDLLQAIGELRAAIDDVKTVYIHSINDLSRRQLPVEVPQPAESLDRARLLRQIPEALAALPARDQAVIRQHYWSGSDLLDVGKELGISKSWASRRHASAIAGMKHWYEHSERQLMQTDVSARCPAAEVPCPV